MTTPTIDLAAETGSRLPETALILFLSALALAYLVRGALKKRRRFQSGGSCGDCSGCATSGPGPCPVATAFTQPETESTK
ncbi:FeoB-associated Cys-rich membrane protein [Maritalea mobilis]|uniref:FeoB-associated Cys-rich membrane protein n=1 Tax=Maritalea mobilis TaxID=483324 RepID=UPI001C972670|nr:FeoB-associated Cys-rich membrane protein [Maritalea mobilis]MBY6201072.1 FeoB-associated Cys-rich membrane protein [Maritalea mobilis]